LEELDFLLQIPFTSVPAPTTSSEVKISLAKVDPWVYFAFNKTEKAFLKRSFQGSRFPLLLEVMEGALLGWRGEERFRTVTIITKTAWIFVVLLPEVVGQLVLKGIVGVERHLGPEQDAPAHVHVVNHPHVVPAQTEVPDLNTKNA
jgi:hypothetical protein